MKEVIERLKDFAAKHDLILEQKGEVGFGRPCVGYLAKGGNYVDINPTDSTHYNEIWERDERLYAPEGVQAYHKHDCMAVLVHDEKYDEALCQLLLWVVHLQSQGEVFTESFSTGATGMQAMISGVTGYAIRLKAAP